MKQITLGLLLAAVSSPAWGACTLPYTLTNGTVANADQVMANMNALATCAQPISGSNANGYWLKIPDGSGGYVIQQWGRIIGNKTEGSYSLTFPIAFTTGVQSIQYAALSSDASTLKDTYIERVSETNTVATYIVNWVPASGSVNFLNGFDWYAIGR